MNRKKVFLIGAASGIGKEVAIRLQMKDMMFFKRYTRRKAFQVLEQLPKEINLLLSSSNVDTSTTEHVSKIIEQNWNELDALLNCADISKPSSQ